MLSEQDITRIIERYVVGLESLATLAKEHHTPYSSLKELLIEKGIKIRNRTESLQKFVKHSNCVICGRQFRMRERWDSTTNHHNKTCGDLSCLHTLRSQSSKSRWTDDRKKMMSEKLTGRDTSQWNIPKKEKRPNWKGGTTSRSYRKIAFKELGLNVVCSKCGTTENVDIHHKDRDKSNNVKENLIALCKACHTSHHSRNGDTGWKLHNKRVVFGISVGELVKELNAGKSLRRICREYNISMKPLVKLMQKYNIKKPERKIPSTGEIVKLLSEGKSVREIGKLYNIPHSTMDAIMKKK